MPYKLYQKSCGPTQCVRRAFVLGAYMQRPFIQLTNRMVIQYRNRPDLIGMVYAISRAAFRHQGPVPLSAGDLHTWLNIPTRATASTAVHVEIRQSIQQLVQDGWVQETRPSGGKAVLLPTWGRSKTGDPYAWDWTQLNRGKPHWVRGPRIPTDLIDILMGILLPQTSKPALLRRGWNVPLIDVVDLGTWILRFATADPPPPTPRLAHIGLTEPTVPILSRMIRLAQIGMLTTLDPNNHPIAVAWCSESTTAQPPCSDQIDSRTVQPHPDAELSHSVPGALCDARIRGNQELINKITIPHAYDPDQHTDREEEDRSVEQSPIAPGSQPEPARHPKIESSQKPNQHAVLRVRDIPRQPSAEVMAGHVQLNPDRPIPPGEQIELALLEQQHGTAALLIWQARAQRRTGAVSGRVIPEYYHACAKQDAFETFRPAQQPKPHRHMPAAAARIQEQPASSYTPHATAHAQEPPQPRRRMNPQPQTLSPAIEELLQRMGIYRRRDLAHVPLELIQRWQPLVTHPALAIRWRDPRAWIWSQLHALLEPPSDADLNAWLHPRSRTNTPCEPVDWPTEAVKLTLTGCSVGMGSEEGQQAMQQQAVAQLITPECMPMPALVPSPIGTTLPPLPPPPLAAQSSGWQEIMQAEPANEPPEQPPDLETFWQQFRLRIPRHRPLHRMLDRAQVIAHDRTLLVCCALADQRTVLRESLHIEWAARDAGFLSVRVLAQESRPHA